MPGLPDHLRYLDTLARHKRLVWAEGRALGVPTWSLLTHDLSKLLPDEWFPSVRWLGTSASLAPAHMAASKRALERHRRRNRHHPEAWLRRGEPLPMPDRYRREMLADWRAVGRSHDGMSTRAWYLANRHRLPLHADTRAWVEQELRIAQAGPAGDGPDRNGPARDGPAQA